MMLRNNRYSKKRFVVIGLGAIMFLLVGIANILELSGPVTRVKGELADARIVRPTMSRGFWKVLEIKLSDRAEEFWTFSPEKDLIQSVNKGERVSMIVLSSSISRGMTRVQAFGVEINGITIRPSSRDFLRSRVFGGVVPIVFGIIGLTCLAFSKRD